MKKRKRATVIVETNKGILLVSHSKERPPTFMLPGGGVRGGEYSIHGAIRELYEETGLHSSEVRYLFSLTTKHHRHKVFLIKAYGRLRRRHETKYIAFWNEHTKSKLKMAWHVRPIIEKYYKMSRE